MVGRKTARRFEDLEIWQDARALVRDLHRVTAGVASREDSALRDQTRRAAVSIMANIAEGFERGGDREFRQFLSQAKASCGELRSHFWILQDLGYLRSDDAQLLVESSLKISRMICRLMQYLDGSPYRGAKFRSSGRRSQSRT